MGSLVYNFIQPVTMCNFLQQSTVFIAQPSAGICSKEPTETGVIFTFLQPSSVFPDQSSAANMVFVEQESTGSTELDCNACLKTFKSKRGLKRHMKTHTDRSDTHLKLSSTSYISNKKINCEACSKKFKSHMALTMHSKTKHSSGVKISTKRTETSTIHKTPDAERSDSQMNMHRAVSVSDTLKKAIMADLEGSSTNSTNKKEGPYKYHPRKSRQTRFNCSRGGCIHNF